MRYKFLKNMAGINKVILVGNLGKDPEVRTVQSGALVARFSVATSETYTNKEGQKVENTEWHNVVLWRGLASVAEKYLKKGNKVYIEGKLRTRQYEDKDGVKKYTTEVEATDMLLLDRPANAGGGGGNYQGNNTNTYSNTNSYTDPAPQNNLGGGNNNTNDSDIPDDLPF
jgi:single-strand DNA-binding protein